MNNFFCFLNTLKIAVLKMCIYFLAILFLVSCNKDASVNSLNQDCNNQLPTILIKGEWELVSAYVLGWTPDGPHFYTPNSLGYTSQIKFTDDSEYVYRNDSLQYSFIYSLQFRKNDPINPQSDSTLMLISGDQLNQNSEIHFIVSCDSLITDDTYVDGARIKYKRK